MIPEKYQTFRRKLLSRFGFVFLEDKIIVPKNLRTTIFSLLHKIYPAINKMSLAARHFRWSRMVEAVQKKCETWLPCKMPSKSFKPSIPSTENSIYHHLTVQTKRRSPIRFHWVYHRKSPLYLHTTVH